MRKQRAPGGGSGISARAGGKAAVEESLEPPCQRADVNADETLDLADWRIVAENASGPY